MKQSFESYLQEQHMEDYHGTDDDSVDAYEAWLENLQIDGVMEYAESYGKKAYNEGSNDGYTKGLSDGDKEGFERAKKIAYDVLNIK